MTAINAPLAHHGSRRAFRRGIVAGIAASLVLVLSLTVGAFAAGLLPDVNAIVPADLFAPAAPAAPIPVEPAAPAAPVAPVVPEVAPPAPAPAKVAPVNPDLPIDYYNPVQKGPAQLY